MFPGGAVAVVGAVSSRAHCTVLVAQLVECPPGYTCVFAKGVSDQVRDPLTPRNSLQ